MPDEPAAPAAADEPAPNNPANGLPDDNPDGEGTTPEEVRSVMSNAGVHLPDEPAAASDDEEGDDPEKLDEPASDEAAADEPAPDDPEEAEDPDNKKPDPKPADEQPVDDDKYSLEVTDANGVTFKIPVGAKMEDILAEFEPKNNGQILDILDQLQEMKAQKLNDENQEAEKTAQADHAKMVSDIQKGWNDEIKDLQATKRLPAGEEGTKRVDEVYKFLGEENSRRTDKNRPLIYSLEDALDKLENKEARESKDDQDKKDKETARKNGSLVGGSSAPASKSGPVYKSGSARNANDAIRSMGLLD